MRPMKPFTDAEQDLIHRAAERIELVYWRAEARVQDLPNGGFWYDDQRARLTTMARIHALPSAAAILSAVALAPRIRWEDVLDGVRDLLAGRPVKRFLKSRVAVAERALAEVREDRWGVGRLFPERTAPKSHAFAHNLLGSARHVTVDVWATRVADLPPPSTARKYRMAVEAYVRAAERCRSDPRRVQEVTWQVVRNGWVELPRVVASGEVEPGTYGPSGRVTRRGG